MVSSGNTTPTSSVTPSRNSVFSVPLFIAIIMVIFGTTALQFPFIALAGIFFRNTNGTETFVCASPANSAFELQDKCRNFSLWAWPVTGLDANGTIQPLSFGFNIGITLKMNRSSLANADGPNTYVLSYFYGFWSGITPSQHSLQVMSTPLGNPLNVAVGSVYRHLSTDHYPDP
ncbi:hypothetical protein HK405_010367 [Cladochytrium tenue]|nr:hypothetical protein HK405_010367 [Cladochytrium tenue]